MTALQPDPILQDRLPAAAWMTPHTARLPGTGPATEDTWLAADEAFGPQMALRDRLIADRPSAVHALLPGARAAADELLALLTGWLAGRPGYAVGADAVIRPDGVAVPLDPARPLLTAGRLVQEDLCLLQDGPDEPLLTGAILCFPASWRLADKIGRPLTAIHAPVPSYDQGIAARVGRMIGAIRPGQVLARMNFNVWDDPTLHQPRAETEPHPRATARLYLRSERQTLRRLPQTGAVVFAIHTYVVPMARLTEDERAGLVAAGR